MQDLPLTAYRTVGKNAETETILHRSRFIGRCWRIADESEALAILERIRKQHWDATHNCYAYALKDGTARYSDDGEPSGTAGMPMMETIKHIGVTDVLVIVTRYFGGILLGAGGLVRAYAHSASDAVKAAGVVIMQPCTQFSVTVPYPYWSTVQRIISQYATGVEATYAETITCTCWVRDTDTESFLTAMRERTEARILPIWVGSDRFPFQEAETLE